MERDKMIKAEVRAALDECLSYVDDLPSLRYDIMRKARGEKPMKKKISVGLIFAIVTMLIAVTALAVTIWNMIGEKAVQLEAEHGYFVEWDTETRIAFVNHLQALGIVLPDSEMAKMNDESLPLEDRRVYATKIIVDLYGREDAISHIDMLEKEKGPFVTWSLEDKAWYSKLLEEYDSLGWDMEYNLLPGEDAISEVQAVQIAANAVSAAYGVTLSDIPTDKAAISFYRYPQDNPNPVWRIEFAGYTPVSLTAAGEITGDQYADTGTPFDEAERAHIQEMDDVEYKALLRKLEAEYGWDQYRWPLEVMAMISHTHRMPTDSDMDIETAILRAKEVLMSTYGFGEDFFDNLTPYVSLSCGTKNLETDTWNYEYTVNFDGMNQPLVCGARMMSDTGEILETYWNADGEVKSNG